MTPETNLRPLPLGSSSFETLRKAGEIYVDKTAMVYQLARGRGKIFLSRPRRFGKSLLVSTFESLFKNGLLHFHGLAIEKLWAEEQSYLTVHLDFSELKKFSDIDSFVSKFYMLLAWEFMQAGFHYDAQSIFPLSRQLSGWLKSLPDNSLVLLIDEYDAPLTACMNNTELFNAVRDELSEFYSSLKSNEGALRFLFITGIMKFGKASVFSELNNLTDISLMPEFSSLLGYTHEEVESCFDQHLNKASAVLGLSRPELMQQITENYDGFCFDSKAEVRVFAPWSLLNFLAYPANGFDNYWIDSAGSPTVLQQYLKAHSLQDPESYFKEKYIPFSQLKARATELDQLDDVLLLTQAGYLTIRNRGTDSFRVSYPNKEVSDALAALYRERLLSGKSLDELGAFNIKKDIESGNAESVIKQLNRLFLSLDYSKYPITDEAVCRSYLQLMLTLGAGVRTFSELHNALGRSDIEVETENLHWVLEIKFMRAGSASDAAAERLLREALEQMKDRHYGESSVHGRKLLRMELVFSEKERQITAFGLA